MLQFEEERLPKRPRFSIVLASTLPALGRQMTANTPSFVRAANLVYYFGSSVRTRERPFTGSTPQSIANNRT